VNVCYREQDVVIEVSDDGPGCMARLRLGGRGTVRAIVPWPAVTAPAKASSA
jgi:hypothetical protein